MHLTTVTIGRNVGRQPMPGWRWENFTDEIRRVIRLLPNVASVTVFDGRGEWDGVEEDSRTFHVLHTAPVPASVLSDWSIGLMSTADYFDQDAIAYSHSASHLAERLPAYRPEGDQAEREAWAAEVRSN